MLRSLGSLLALCAAAALLSACPPPAAPDPAAENAAAADLGSATSASPADAPHSSAASRRVERRDASAGLPSSGQYKYVDERGKLRLAATLEDVPERQRSTATPLEPPASATRARSQRDGEGIVQTADVTIYTTSYCGYCRAAMAHFDKLGIEYVNHDIEADEDARAEVLELTGGRSGVPVIVVGDAWMQGWSQTEFDRLLASAR